LADDPGMAGRSRFNDKVVMITGAARGQGRSHALAFAREGADLVLCDLGSDARPTSVPYPLSEPDDLAETQRLVEETGRRAIACEVDVRSSAQLDAAVAQALEMFGRIDVLVANAGIAGISTIAEMTDEQWDEMIAINLGGVFRSLRAVTPHMIEREQGRIVATSSIVGRQGSPNIGHYVAAKWGVIGLVKSLALEVAGQGITVNAVCPTSVNTLMIQNEPFHRLFLPDKEEIVFEDVVQAYTDLNPVPKPWLEPHDVSAAVLFLASDQARFITGEALSVALGWNARNAA
jgi:SDR family mycofactocin-dependent oxidoreductase